MTTSYDTFAAANRLFAEGVRNVLSPLDPDFAEQLVGFNLQVRHTPEAVVVATGEDDVVTTVRVAREMALPLSVLGHGHGWPAGITSGITLATAGLAGVEIDAEQRTARVGAGTTWAAVIEAAAGHGLAPLCGSAPHVGVVGYLLGGGIGPVARTYGFAADHVRSMRVVTGTGEVVVATADQHPDLFWALRGGKGGLGVVTEVTIDLFGLPFVQAGGFFFDGADAATVLRTWVEWSSSVPENVTTSVALLRLPPLEHIPEPLRGRFVVHVRVVVVGDADEAGRLVNPIRDAASPILAMFEQMPYAAIGAVHQDPVEAMPVVEGGLLLRSLDALAVDSLLEVAGPSVDAPLVAVELRLLGGALSRQPEVPNAVGGRDAAYGLHVVGAPVPELLAVVVPAAIDGVFEALGPWQTGGVQVNFFGNGNAPTLLELAWPAEVRTRLAGIRRAYDPDGLFPYDGHGPAV